MTWRERRRARKLRLLEDRRDDLEEHLYEWGFSMAPSVRRRMRERISKLEERIDEMGQDDESQ